MQNSIPSENVRHNQERYLKWLYKIDTKEGLTKFLADIKNIHEEYAQSVIGNPSTISISTAPETVKEKIIKLRDRALKNGLDILSVVKKRPFRARLISYLKDFLSPFLYLFRLW